mmetsp:Transcript_70851/g.156308  ORF Transcript_70851/g.156308 Transcript_70851/m.156308 type:complete len:170 (-) Transcript_70851:73-582(-)
MDSTALLALPYDLVASVWANLDVIGFFVVLTILLVVGLLECLQHRAQSKRNGALDASTLPEISLDALKAFDGVQLPMTYCCIKGRIYDVSSSANFQPGSAYHFLAGADATIGLAMMSYDRSLVNSLRYDMLKPRDWQALEHWVSHMDSKYACVALLKEYKDFVEKGSNN